MPRAVGGRLGSIHGALMAKKQISRDGARPDNDKAKKAVEEWYRSTTYFTNKPLVRPDESEAVDADLRLAKSLGMTDADAIAYAENQLRVRRRDVAMQLAAIKHMRSETGRRGGKKGSATTNADHKELHSQYQGRIDELVAPEVSYEAASKIVAAEFGVSPGTVKRHTKNPAPRNSSRRRR